MTVLLHSLPTILTKAPSLAKASRSFAIHEILIPRCIPQDVMVQGSTDSFVVPCCVLFT
jgi:hypothetical protein